MGGQFSLDLSFVVAGGLKFTRGANSSMSVVSCRGCSRRTVVVVSTGRAAPLPSRPEVGLLAVFIA